MARNVPRTADQDKAVAAQGGRESYLVAEEMLMWGYRGSPRDGDFLPLKEAEALLDAARASDSVNPHAAATTLDQELALLPELEGTLKAVAEDRCTHLVEAHERFSKAVGGNRFSVVKPVLPMDIMGVHVLLPEVTP